MSCGCGSSNNSGSMDNSSSSDGLGPGGLFSGAICSKCLLFWILIALVTVVAMRERKR